MGLASSQFTNQNSNFTVTFNVTDGSMTITPVTDEVVVTITGATDTKTYDGVDHIVSGYEVSYSNDLYDASSYLFSGTASASQTDAGTTNMGLTAADFANTNENFTKVTFNVTDGYVTVDPLAVTVGILGNTVTAEYDGAEHTAAGYTVSSISSDLYTADDIAFSGTASASQTDVGTANMGLTADQFANNNGNYTVTFEVTDGSVTITPAPVYTLTVNYVYADGTAAAPAVVLQLTEGTTYSISSPTVSGYTAGTSSVSGTMPGSDLTFTITYTQNPDTQTPDTQTPVTVVPSVVIEDSDGVIIQPVDPEQNLVVEPDEEAGGYKISQVPDEDVPLADINVEEHNDCILHVLLALAALLILLWYMHDMKKLQKRINELKAHDDKDVR
jgi:hypothetical protein